MPYTLLGYTRIKDTQLTGLPLTPGYTWKLRILEDNIYLLRLRIREVTVVCYTNTSREQIESEWQDDLLHERKKMTYIINELNLFILHYKKIASPK